MRSPALALSALIAFSAHASGIEISEAWVRAPAPGQTVVGGYLDITSRDADATLVSASSPVAGVTELHEMSMKEGVMVMRPVPYIRLPKGQTVKLKPGGLHLMLIDLKRPLKAGDKVPLTLKTLANGKTALHEISAEVRSAPAQQSRQHPHAH